jgi:hypothetical protein
MIKYEFTYNCDPAFAFSVKREFFWDRHSGMTLSFLIVGIVAIIGLRTGSYQGFWAFCLGMSSFYGFNLVQTLRQIKSIKKTTETIKVKVVLDENGCALETDFTRGWASWSCIKRVHRLKSGIVLERKDGSSPATIPVQVLTEDVSRFIDQSIKQAKLINAKSVSIQR